MIGPLLKSSSRSHSSGNGSGREEFRVAPLRTRVRPRAGQSRDQLRGIRTAEEPPAEQSDSSTPPSFPEEGAASVRPLRQAVMVFGLSKPSRHGNDFRGNPTTRRPVVFVAVFPANGMFGGRSDAPTSPYAVDTAIIPGR